MKMVDIGGTGPIASELVNLLRARGDAAIALAPQSGADTLAGAPLAKAAQR